MVAAPLEGKLRIDGAGLSAAAVLALALLIS